MLYLRNTTDLQTLRIPASGPKVSGKLVISLLNTINRGTPTAVSYDPRYAFLLTKDGKYVQGADGLYIVVATKYDVRKTSGLYYFARVTLPEGMQEGEYEYTAAIDDEVISVGLLIVGDRTAPIEENKNTVEYEQYNAFN